MPNVRRVGPLSRLAVLVQSTLLVVAMFAGIPPAASRAATNYGLALNGSSQYVTFGQAPGLGAPQFTLELWFMRTGAGVGTSTGTGGLLSAIPLITKGRAEGETPASLNMNYFLGIDSGSGKLVGDFEDTAGGVNHPVTGVTVVTSNSWHHAAATYDGTTWRLYLDGNLDVTTVVGSFTPEATSIQHAALGTAMTSSGAAAGFFQGVIDEARIWSAARTQAQIQAAKDTDITAAQTGLLGHWGLNEGAGTAANNTFGSAGVSGTLAGTPAWGSGYSGTAATNYGLALNGSSQYVTFGQALGLNAPQFTLELWFMRTGAGVGTSTGSGGITAIPLITKGRAEAEGSNVDMNYFLGIDATSGKLVADFEEGTGGTGPLGLNHPVSANTVVTSNVWHHAAATYDGTWKIYLDGNLDGTLVVNQPPRSDSIQHAALGTAMTSSGAAAGFFQGVIDEARIWSAARTQAQIQAAKDTDITAAQTGLLGHWGLNEGAGTVANNTFGTAATSGTTFGTPAWGSGYSGAQATNYGLALNGSTQYVTFGPASGLNAPQFTLELWFMRTGAGVGTSTGTGGLPSAIPLITKGRAESETPANLNMNYFLGIDSGSGKLVGDFEDTAGGVNHTVTGVTAVTSNSWHHAAATYDGTTWRLYLDGNLDVTTVVGSFTPEATSIQHAALGTAMTSTGVAAGFFQGVIDEARIWSAARTQAQIQAAKDTDITAAQTGLLGHWGLNEGAGTDANNTFGTAATKGSLVGAPTWTGGFVVPVIDTTPPAAPQNLVASAAPNSGASLTWSANTESDLAGYNVYRSTTSPVATTGSPLNGSLLASSSYTDSSIIAGTTYFYRVVAVDTSANPSVGSNEATTTLAAGNYALQLNGSTQYGTVGSTTNLRASQFTVETWFKRAPGGVTANTGANGLDGYPLITKGRAEAETAAADVNYFFGIDAAGHLAADFEEAAGGATPSLNHPIAGASVIAADNTWHHAAATYDGTSWKLYLDGDLDGQLLVGQPANAATNVLTAIGTSMNTAGVAAGIFSGTIDEARIWNVARSQAQIQATKDVEIGTPTTGLLGEWRLNEGIGASLGDGSGNSVSGVTTGTPIWVAGFVPPTPNGAPTVALVGPSDGATGTAAAPQLSVTPTDPEGLPLTVTFFGRAYASGTFAQLATVPTTPSGTPAATAWSGRGDGQRYEWYVTVFDGSKTTTSPTWTFNTAPGADPVLVGAGDIAGCATSGDETTAAIVTGVQGGVFTLGDNAYDNGLITEFTNCYGPSWGVASIKSRTRPTSGNHDFGNDSNNGDGYFDFFDGVGASDGAAGPRNTGIYSYDIGSRWHVVVLNSECGHTGVGCTATSPQATWLKADLAAHADRNVIAMIHRPFISSGVSNGLSALSPLWSIFYDYGVDLVLSGHDHHYEVFDRMNANGTAVDATSGVREIIVGTGGFSETGTGTVKTGSLVRNFTTFGVLKLTLHQASYDWAFLPESGATFTDSGSSPVNDGANRSPVISSVSISPTSPTTTQTLTATVTASDPDGDSLTTAYQWTKNGTDIAGATGSTLNLATVGNGDRGDVIRVRATVSDGIATSAPVTSSPTTIVNAAPTATVSLSPTGPTTNQTVTATATKADADGDPVGLTFVWSVGTTVVKTTPSSSGLTDSLDLSVAGNGDKGQLVSVAVTPSDGALSGTAASSSTTVANSAPTVGSASIAEATATTSAILHAAGTWADPDGDAVTIAYQWTNNGADLTGATTSSLDLSVAGNGDKGQIIRVRLTPSDATTSGVAVTSAGLTIANSAPSTTVVVDDDSPDSNAVLTATAAKADVDGDAVTLTYVWRVNGTVKKTTTATTSVTDSFDLGIAGNGDTGDAVTVAVTPSDGIASGTSASATATVVADTNAPAAPGSSAVSVTTASIALDWPDNTEHDVAGYRVYRGASASGAFTLLTPSLLTTSTYTDGSPVVGDLYYRVTSVDTTGNESLPTTAVVSRSIALRSATTGQSTGTTLTITKPSGTASGDVVVAMIDLAGTASITAPSGWTVVRNDTNGTALRQAIFWHVAGSSDSSYPFTFGAAQGATAILAAYVGVDTASPFDPSTGQTGSGTAITGPSLSASANAALIMVSGVATSTTIAPASGMAERGEVGSSGKAKLDTEFADQILGPAGTTGNRVTAALKAGANIGQLVAIRASGSPPPPPPPATVPGAPRNLVAAAGSSTVSLSWAVPTSDGGANITNYRIYKGTASGGESFLIQVGNVTGYQDTAVSNGTTYYYKLTAVNSVGEGGVSNEGSAQPASANAPGAPTNLVAAPGRPRGISLTWTAPASDGGSAITGYRILRGTSAGAETDLTSVSNVTSYKDTTTTKGLTYFYTVEAINAIGTGPLSNEANATAR